MTLLSEERLFQGWPIVVPKKIANHIDMRAFEWFFSIPMVQFGIYMLAVPAAMNGSILRVLVLSIGGTLAALLFICTGITGIVALIANGNSERIGPRLRAFCAMLRAVIWLTFVLSMLRVSEQQPWVSPMVFFWFWFMVAEVWIAHKAGQDVRPSDH